MANENKPMKYTRYAIGEIVLVVIGILIALQINTWNEERKEKILQFKILNEIDRNLDLDLIEIRKDISYMDSVNLACIRVLDHLKNRAEPSLIFEYDIATIRANPHFDPNKSGYSLLVSKGLDIIKNDSLRELISVLYESNYSYYKRYEEERTQFKIQYILPFIFTNAKMEYRPELFFRASGVVSQNDYNTLKENDAIIKLVSAISTENSMVQDRAFIIEKRILNLKAMLIKDLSGRTDKKQ